MSTHIYAVDKVNKKLVDMGNAREGMVVQDYYVWDKFMGLIDNLPEIDFKEVKARDIDLKTLNDLISGYKLLTGMTEIFCYFRGLVYCYNNELDFTNQPYPELVYEGDKKYESYIKQKWEIV